MKNQLLCDDPESSPKLYLRYIIDNLALFDNDYVFLFHLEQHIYVSLASLLYYQLK